MASCCELIALLKLGCAKAVTFSSSTPGVCVGGVGGEEYVLSLLTPTMASGRKPEDSSF
jgi:hypothetical protein